MFVARFLVLILALALCQGLHCDTVTVVSAFHRYVCFLFNSLLSIFLAFRPMARIQNNRLSMSFELEKVVSTLSQNKILTQVCMEELILILIQCNFSPLAMYVVTTRNRRLSLVSFRALRKLVSLYQLLFHY